LTRPVDIIAALSCPDCISWLPEKTRRDRLSCLGIQVLLKCSLN